MENNENRKIEFIDKYLFELEKCLFEQGIVGYYFSNVEDVFKPNFPKGYGLNNILFLYYLREKALKIFYENLKDFVPSHKEVFYNG